MRIIYSIMAVLLLTGCGIVKEPIKINENAKTNTNVVVPPTAEVTNEQFTLKLISEKSSYTVGEPLVIRAELTNNTEEDLEIGHGGSWIFLNTTNVTEDYQFGGAMNEPYIITPIKAKETIVENYHFSGSTYSNDMPGQKYSDEVFEKMSNMEFPIGTYKIEGITSFHIVGTELNQELKTEITFNVTK